MHVIPSPGKIEAKGHHDSASEFECQRMTVLRKCSLGDQGSQRPFRWLVNFTLLASLRNDLFKGEVCRFFFFPLRLVFRRFRLQHQVAFGS